MDIKEIIMISGFGSLVLVSLIGMIVSSVSYKKIRKMLYSKNKEEMAEMKSSLEKELNSQSPEYSDKVLEFGQKFAAQASLIQYRSYMDNHEKEKITRGQITKLISEISENINISISYDNIDFSRTIFTREYFEKFLIETIVLSIKELLSKDIIEI